AGDGVEVEIEPAKEWPEPEVPADLKTALAASPEAQAAWEDVTTAARWDWIRWINSTGNPETRRKRIGVACSKLETGKRRPCCFNRNMCTEPEVSKGGVLAGAGKS
ncbi:MAG: YdeI/OmpD-associated family protein, partial [bacterium]